LEPFQETTVYDDFWNGFDDIEDAECVAVLKCFIAASTHEDSGLLTVAGYMFESGRVRRFKQEWLDTFGPSKFSWADLIARQKPFTHRLRPVVVLVSER